MQNRSQSIKTDNYEIGRYSYFSPDLQLRTWQPHEKIVIGNFCSIADKVQIFCGGQHRVDVVSTFPFDAHFAVGSDGNRSYKSTNDTVIGSDVWLASGCTILGGVTIGHGAVIGAGALVRADVAPYAVVAGNPAVVVKFRFNEEIIKKLLLVQWWEWNDEKIRENLEWFYKPVPEFVDFFG